MISPSNDDGGEDWLSPRLTCRVCREPIEPELVSVSTDKCSKCHDRMVESWARHEDPDIGPSMNLNGEPS